MRTVERGGDYFRVCDPSWADPCDPTFSAKAGGRWNAPGSFPVLYLSADRDTARANARRNFEGEAFTVFDLNPTARPHLQVVVVSTCRPADAVSDAGLLALGLPTTYPKGVGHEVCQPIGAAVRRAGRPGIACRSAAHEGGEELALMDQDAIAGRKKRYVFDEWFLRDPDP